MDKTAIVNILERLQVSLAFDIAVAQSTLDSLAADLRVGFNLLRKISYNDRINLKVALATHSPRLQMLIVDSITPLLAPLLSAVSGEGD